MKKLFNSHLPNGKLNEVVLFDHMTKLFTNKKTTAIFIKRAHQTYVRFSLNGTLKKIKREIGDLIFLVFDKTTKTFKICILQAKYRKQRPSYDFHFNAEYNQWKLLKDRPDIISCKLNEYPKHILNFRKDYKSITAYGIFYHDMIDHDIDFLYIIPDNIESVNLTTKSINRSFKLKSGSTRYYSSNPDEEILAYNMDEFEKYMKAFKIGAPVCCPTLINWIKSVVVTCYKNRNKIIGDYAKDNTTLFDIMRINQWNENDTLEYNFNFDINVIFLCTDSEYYRNLENESNNDF